MLDCRSIFEYFSDQIKNQRLYTSPLEEVWLFWNSASSMAWLVDRHNTLLCIQLEDNAWKIEAQRGVEQKFRILGPITYTPMAFVWSSDDRIFLMSWWLKVLLMRLWLIACFAALIMTNHWRAQPQVFVIWMSSLFTMYPGITATWHTERCTWANLLLLNSHLPFVGLLQ